MRAAFGLTLSTELHASHLLNRPGELVSVAKNDRLTIIRAFANEVVQMEHVRCICVQVDKTTSQAPGYDVFDNAWRALHPAFGQHAPARQLPTGRRWLRERSGCSFPMTPVRVNLKRLVGRVRRLNPVPNQATFGSGYSSLRVTKMIEYPSSRDSAESYFVQVADLVAFLHYREFEPSRYMRKTGGQAYFRRLAPVLLRQASSNG